MHLAAAKDNVEMIKFLIAAGANRTAKDKFGRTALVLAVMNGSFRSANVLLQYGAPFDLPDSSKNFPLHYACAYGYPEMIEILMEAGADPNSLNSWNMSPTTVALLKNYFECVKKMLEYDSTDVNCVDNDGRSLLSNSVKQMGPKNFEKFIYLLEDKKGNPNSVDQFGLSVLHHVCRTSPKNLRS